MAGNSYTTTNTLLLGAVLPVTTASTTESVALFSLVDDSATAAGHDTQHNTQSTEEATPTVHVASTLTTEADVAAPVNASEDNTGVAAAAVAETAAVTDTPVDESYSIGGVVITLADGSIVEGASVNGSSGADTVVVSDLNFSHIDGGAGTDTLVLNGDHLTLDLTDLGLKVENIEVLDLGQSGTNAVKLDLNEALNITDQQSDDRD